MKNNIIKSIIFIGIIGMIGSASCKKKIDDAYLNPNAAVVEPIETILPGVIGGFTWFSFHRRVQDMGNKQMEFVNRYIQYMGHYHQW